MNIWILLYLAVFIIFSIAGIVDDMQEGRPLWFLALAVLSNAIIVILFISFWNHSWLEGVDILAQVLFVAAMVWEVYQVALDTFATRTAQVASTGQEEGDHGASILSILLFSVLFLPAYFIAGISAFGRQ